MSRVRRKRKRASPPTRGRGARTQNRLPAGRGVRLSRRTVVRAIVTVVLIGGGGSAVWWASRPRPKGHGSGFNVLLITLDTVRADHLGCYGHPGNLTPNIDRLAAEGTRFGQCTSAAPSTLPAHATILTATYPYVHGVRHNVGYRLTEANATLAEVLQQAGYQTAAYVGAFVLNRDTGFDQGFHTYDDAGRRHERPANEVCDGAIDWLRHHASERFFLWTHFFDPHSPYDPPEPFRTSCPDSYQGEIAFADQQVGRLLEELHRLGLEAETLVVLTADHGEGLGQHEEPTHLYFVYDTTMSVPLIFRCPGQIPSARAVPTQVRNVDIAPTVLAFLGLPTESAMPAAQGTSLVTRMLTQARQPDLPAYGETLAGQIVLGTAALRCLRTQGWKYVHAPQPELYDTRQDPEETRNLVAREAERAAAMREQLREIIAASPQPVPADDASVRVDQTSLDRLQGLGYVGGESLGPSSPLGEIDRFAPVGEDPKDHAGDFAAVGRAVEFLQTGRYADAEAIYRRLVSVFPDATELAMQLARSVFLQNRLEEAIALYRDLLESRPDSAMGHYGLAKLLDRIGSRAEAIEHFAIAVGLDPGYPEAHYDLGVALGKEGRAVEALDCFRKAVRARPTYVDARVNLGAGLAAAGKLDQAIEQYRQALRVAPGDAVIHYSLGNALLRKGRTAEAISAYQEALRLKPDFLPARQALSRARQLTP